MSRQTALPFGTFAGMKILVLIGRILFALIFLAAAPRHFSNEGVSHAAELGVPFAGLLVPIAGVMAVVGALSVATGYRASMGAWVLIAFLIPVTLGMHAFWKMTDPYLRHIQLSMFAKNLSMLGCALLLTQRGGGAFSLGCGEDDSSVRG
jgi:putative oxidoreductase